MQGQAAQETVPEIPHLDIEVAKLAPMQGEKQLGQVDYLGRDWVGKGRCKGGEKEA